MPRDNLIPSITEVARQAGVSITTVSHALSGRRPVNPETARRVREVVAAMGYVPASTARNLRSGQTKVLGLIVPDISNNFFGRLAKGVEDAVHSRGFALILCNTDFDAVREDHYLDLLRSRFIDGLIYASGSAPTTERLGTLVSSFPIALADEEVPGLPGALLVTADHRQGGQLAGSHLRELGHERALVVSGPRGLRSSDDRIIGFLEHVPDSVVRVGDFMENAGFHAVSTALAAKTTFTAVFALNDLMAVGVIAGLAAAGLRVPQDVSVIGFDDIQLTNRLNPALTTIRQPAFEVGHAAAVQLVDRIEHQSPAVATRTVLPVRLVVRDSTSSAPTPNRPKPRPSPRKELNVPRTARR